jgi:hypothetical protein
MIDFARNETRFRMVEQQNPARFKALMEEAQTDIFTRWATYEQLALAMAPRPKSEDGKGT